jgi:hypothetical protein
MPAWKRVEKVEKHHEGMAVYNNTYNIPSAFHLPLLVIFFLLVSGSSSTAAMQGLIDSAFSSTPPLGGGAQSSNENVGNVRVVKCQFGASTCED